MSGLFLTIRSLATRRNPWVHTAPSDEEGSAFDRLIVNKTVCRHTRTPEAKHEIAKRRRTLDPDAQTSSEMVILPECRGHTSGQSRDNLSIVTNECHFLNHCEKR